MCNIDETATDLRQFLSIHNLKLLLLGHPSRRKLRQKLARATSDNIIHHWHTTINPLGR